jgi:two-component system, NtrC family, response regulator HydG
MNDEEQQLRAALALAKNSPAKAGELLGVTRMTVWRRMKKYGIEIERAIKAA